MQDHLGGMTHGNGAVPQSCKTTRSDTNNINGSNPHRSTTSAVLLTGNQKSIWTIYKTWAREHESKIWLLDQVVARLLLWLPTSNAATPVSEGEQSHWRWREVGYGLLDLHRFLIEIATSNDEPWTKDGAMSSPFLGTSVSIIEQDNVQDRLSFPPSTSLRVALTVLQSILPAALEIARSPGPIGTTMHRLAAVKQYIERARFVLRLALLLKYWRCVQNSVFDVAPGLLLHGGLYHAPIGLTVEQEQSRMERLSYVGRRTGRRSVVEGRDKEAKFGGLDSQAKLKLSARQLHQPSNLSSVTARLRIIAGELLYVCRPLLQAETNAWFVPSSRDLSLKSTKRLQTSWLLCLLMDVTSLLSLHACAASGNSATRDEWHRRRMRLCLYLLRSPVWNTHTEKALSLVTNGVIAKIPLVGSLLNSYIWDWVYYWQVYRAEEG